MSSQEKSILDNQVEWNKDTVYALGPLKRLGSVLGIWPTKNRKSSLIRVAVISIVQLVLVIVFIKDLYIYGNCGTTIELVDALSVITTSCLSMIKVISLWLHQKGLQRLIESVVEDWFCVPDGHVRKVMLKYAYIGRIVLFVQLFGAYMTIIPLMIARLPEKNQVFNVIENDGLFLRNIPIGPRCWISITTPPYLYLAYYSFVCFHLLISATAYLGSDIFIFGIAMHVCGQFDILYESMSDVDGNETYMEQRQLIAKFSKRHTHLLELAYQFEDASNLIIFFEVVVNTFLICFFGIMLIWALKVVDGGTILLMIVRIVVMYIQLFMYSYIGESLSNRAEELQIAIYNCPWYKMSPHTIKDMKFIMMLNNYIFHLTAGKIYTMNISNFKDLVKSMFSCFSILRLVFEDSK